MSSKRIRQKLADKSGFIVYVELVGGPGFSFAPIEKFLRDYNAGAGVIPAGFDFAGVTLPQNPGGLANINPADVLARLTLKNLCGPLDFMPHISCKDHNAHGIVSLLAGYKNAGAETILLLTGDKPIGAKGVFELDSIGLLKLVGNINNDAYVKAPAEQWERVHQFFPGAAVSPFKYSEASQMQQYYKMEKKIACGAKFFITQVGWDWRKSLELFRYFEGKSVV